MKSSPPFRVLLVSEAEANALRLGNHLDALPAGSYQLERASFAAQGLELLQSKRFDALLADQPAGQSEALDLIREARAAGCKLPMLVLADGRDTGLPALAAEAGADVVMVWQDLEALTLDRQLRHAISQHEARALLEGEQTRLTDLVTSVQGALTRRGALDAQLSRCAAALAKYCGADLAQIWSVTDLMLLELKADAGDMGWRRVCAEGRPLLTLDLAGLTHRKLILIDDFASDSRACDPGQALELGIRGVAVHPILDQERLVGLVLLARASAFTPQVLRDLSCVAPLLATRMAAGAEPDSARSHPVIPRRDEEPQRNVIFQVDAFGHWTFLNPAWTALTGFFVKTTINTPFIQYVHLDDREKCSHVFVSLVNGRLDYFRFELRLLTAEGKTRWVELFLQPAVGTDGSIHGVSGNLADITERHESERTQQRPAAAPEVNAHPVVELDEKGAVTFCNQAATQLVARLGCAGVEEILPPQHAEMARRCLETGAGRLQQEVQISGQTLAWSFYSVAGYPVVHCHGEDVTATRQSETQSHQVQRIESLGQLTASAAHDFNNLLTVILGHAQGLLNIVREEKPLAYPLEAISEAARRGAALSRRLALFSRRKEVHPRALDLNRLLNNHAPMLERILGDDVALQLELERDLPAVEGDAGLIEQLLMNLAVNAREAMPRGGALLVQTRFMGVSPEHAQQHPEAQAGPFVCLTLQDSGPGMDLDTKARLFDPFFARNESGKPAGIGLATVYGIVQQHRGWIEVESEPGAGAAFHIYLPQLNAESNSPLAPAAPLAAVRGGGESILLVDDESDLREMLQNILERLGYQVQTAVSASDALRLWDEVGGRFDLVISDVLMPEGMNGRDLAHHLVQRAPGLKVILSSGSSEEELGLLSGEGRFEFLPKPFVPEAFSRLVRKVLDERVFVPATSER